MEDINPFQNKGAALDSMTCITQTYSRSEAPLAVARAFLPLETPCNPQTRADTRDRQFRFHV
jgi:hypothetical protein